MPEGQVLEFTHVTKRFNEVTAVSDFSARVEPGAVTAFLGPNGAGKTTTLRILLGQVRATSGTATIGGTAYAELRQPLRTIGSVLEETVYRPRRTAERQLTIAAKANGIPLARVGEVLSLVGLEGEGGSRIGGFSLGMRQRLSVAHALLGDPGALVFDEPANGLDPEGIRWMRLLMRRLADEGRTVLVSSHVLSEVEQVADNVLVLSKGTLVLSSGIETLADPKGGSVIVDAADRSALTTALQEAGFDIEVLRSGLTVRGGDAGTVGAVAADAGIALSTLVQRGPTLEDVFIDLMRGGRFAPSTPATPPQLAAAAPEDIAAAVTPPEDTTAESTTAEDTTAESTVESAVETSVAEPAPAPADSVVAIPVAAAAAWAAEAAAAPAGEAPIDDLAASVDTGDRSERTSDESDAPSSDASASTDDAPAAELDAEHAQADSAPSEESPERSFDEILFGSAAPAGAAGDHATDPASGDEHHSGVEVFAGLHDAPESTDTDKTDDQLGTGSPDDDALASTSDADDSDSASDSTDDSDSDSDDVAAVTADDEDPRSAAVSSMLAAAARAYYEDEPRDYPLSAENVTTEEQQGEGGVSDEGAHWTVASTGVIDTVPLAASTDSGEAGDTAASDAEEPGAEESPTEEVPAEEAPAEKSPTDAFGADEHGTEQSGTADSDADEHSEHRHDDEHRHDEHRHDDEHRHG